MISVDIVESMPVLLQGMMQIFTEARIHVRSAHTALDLAAVRTADLFIVDATTIPTGDRAALIAKWSLSIPVLVTFGETSIDVAEHLGVGAVGVLSKREPAHVWLNAVRAAASSRHAEQPDLRARAWLPSAPAEPATKLSEREEQVLWQVSRGLTHGQIAMRLGISRHTVDTYVKRLRAKLGAGNKAQLTRAALMQYGSSEING